jgi:conjugative transfer signal peptidase TraF
MRLILIGVLAFAVVLPTGIHSSGLLMNYTDSVPVGLYKQCGKSPDAYAAFCLPSAAAERALQAGLQAAPGECPGGLSPILKPMILASAEHPISLTERGFFVDGKLLVNTAPKSQSRTGAALGHYPFGVYTNGFWAVSDFNPNSYDSRYFGPVEPDAIRFYAKPVWTW